MAGATGLTVMIPNGRASASRLIEVELKGRRDGIRTVHRPLRSQYKRAMAPVLVQELEVYRVVSATGAERQFHKGDLNLEGLFPGEELPACGAAFDAELGADGLQISIRLK